MTSAIVMPVAMLVAMAIDRIVGQPPHALHPVVGIGRYLQWAGRRLPELRRAHAFGVGVLAWLLGAAPLVAAAWALQAGAYQAFDVFADGSIAATPLAVVLSVMLGIVLQPMLAWRMLHDEVAAVQRALAAGLEPGRERVGRLVSRDTAALDVVQVRETAIETLAENLNDSVIAPLFWFAVAGLPGAVLYRYANTADAMWGYRGRWEWAGKWAARVDDVLSWLPARLTALALLPRPGSWPVLARQASRTPSPNGGWPMGAMALALGVRLGKPGAYLLNPEGRAAVAIDVDDALRRAGRALWPAIASLLALAFALRTGS
jgi:adenosylcobinamide-phosphate synthase